MPMEARGRAGNRVVAYTWLRQGRVRLGPCLVPRPTPPRTRPHALQAVLQALLPLQAPPRVPPQPLARLQHLLPSHTAARPVTPRRPLAAGRARLEMRTGTGTVMWAVTLAGIETGIGIETGTGIGIGTGTGSTATGVMRPGMGALGVVVPRGMCDARTCTRMAT